MFRIKRFTTVVLCFRSNCHPGILSTMRAAYSRPEFLPLDAEHAHHDFIFMGYSQGAAMHVSVWGRASIV